MKRNALLLVGIFILVATGYEGMRFHRSNLAGGRVSVAGGMILPRVLEVPSATKPGICWVSAACEMAKQGVGSEVVSTLKQDYSLYVDEKGTLSVVLMQGSLQQGGSYFYTATMLAITAMEAKDTYKLTYYGVVNTDRLAGSWNHPIAWMSDEQGGLPWSDAKSWAATKLDTITLTAERNGLIKIKPR